MKRLVPLIIMTGILLAGCGEVEGYEGVYYNIGNDSSEYRVGKRGMFEDYTYASGDSLEESKKIVEYVKENYNDDWSYENLEDIEMPIREEIGVINHLDVVTSSFREGGSHRSYSYYQLSLDNGFTTSIPLEDYSRLKEGQKVKINLVYKTNPNRFEESIESFTILD